MKKVGFIGYGSMGRMLANGFLQSGRLTPGQTLISNRTIVKTRGLARKWKGITLTNSNRTVARTADVLFICVKPLEVLPVLQEIKPDLRVSTYLISIAGCVSLKDLESQFAGRISRVIPSLTSEVKEGISLVCHNSKVSTGENLS